MLDIACRLLGLPSPTALAAYALAFALACAASFGCGWTVNGWRWEAAVAAQKQEAAALLQQKTDEVRQTELAALKRIQDLERTNAEGQDALNRAYADARRTAAAAGGLRDPGRRPGCGCPVPKPAPAPGVVAEGAPAQGLLSAEASGFLFDLAREADGALEDLHTCHADALTREPQ